MIRNNKKYLKFLFIFLLIIQSFCFSSCSNKTKQKSIVKKEKNAVSNKLTIGFSIDTLAIERWQRDLDIFINKARELGAEVIVQNAGNSINEQNRQLQYLLEKNVDVIVVLPKKADSLTDSIQKIKAKNIPVISYDRLLLNTDIDFYLTVDSEKVGQTMASGLLSKTDGKKWFLMLGPEDDYNMILVQKGITSVLKNTSVNIAYTHYASGWNYDLSSKEILKVFSSDNIPDAIICGNDAVAESIILAISKYYPDKHIPICGQDADIAACQYITQGKQSFTVYKPISQLAELAAECAVKLAKHEEITINSNLHKTINNGYGDIPGIWLEPILVDENNIDEIVISSGFHTKDSIYPNK